MVAMTTSVSGSFVARLVRWRVWIQAAFLLVWLDPFMLRLHNVCGPVFHCYSCPLATFACPIGVLANFSAIHVVPLVAIGTLAIIGGLVGSMLCGYACPFGLLQDLAGRIPTPKVRLPAWLGYTRYAVLGAFVLAVPFLFGENHPLFFCSLCPAGALEGWLPNAVKVAAAGGTFPWANPLKLGVLVFVLVAMFVKWRPWCTLLCPLGAIFGLFNRGSLLVLRYESHACTGCGRCRDWCKYDVLPNKNVNSTQCIRCLECTQCSALRVGSAFTPTTAAQPRGPTEAIRRHDQQRQQERRDPSLRSG
jgi:polyferredoxin